MTGQTEHAGSNGSAPVDILLIGLGSIGSIYAHFLERTGRARVTAVARSNYELYSSGKVTLSTKRWGDLVGWKPYRVVKSQEEALEGNVHYSFCLLCTKCLPDINPTSKLLEPAIKSGKVGAWCLIQNGLRVEEDLYEAVKHLDTPIISSLAWIGIMSSPDGSVVTWKAPVELLVSGIYPSLPPPHVPNNHSTRKGFTNHEKEALELWKSILEEAGAEIQTTDQVECIRYSKNIWNCAWASIESLARTLPATWHDMDTSITQPIKNLIREIVDVGYDSGLLYTGMKGYPMGGHLETREVVAEQAWTRIMDMSVAAGPGKGHKMSMFIDIEMGRPFEVEVIIGAVIKTAREHNVKTPLLDYTYALLKGTQAELVRQQNLKREAADSASA